jgi:import inner membrane translocase subunit TIM44
VATTETDIAKAIKSMRMIDPDFDLFELEKEAKVIFQNIYHLFL